MRRHIRHLIARPIFHGYVLLAISTLALFGSEWQFWRTWDSWPAPAPLIAGMLAALWVGFCAGVLLNVPRNQL